MGIFRPFLDALTPDGKYSLGNRDNLPQPIQMQLSQKPKIFPPPFTAFLRSTLNSEHFEKRSEPHTLCISEIIDCERRAYVNAKESCFSTPYDRQHFKRCQPMLKYPRLQIC